jgi:hypothetical protein
MPTGIPKQIVHSIEPNTRQQCVELIPNPENIEAKNAMDDSSYVMVHIFL